MTDIETEIKATSARLFDLYYSEINIGLLQSTQSYEELKKSYIDNALAQMKIDLVKQRLKEQS